MRRVGFYDEVENLMMTNRMSQPIMTPGMTAIIGNHTGPKTRQILIPLLNT